MCDLNAIHLNKRNKEIIDTREFNNANINVFKQAINEISWPSVFSDNSNPELSFSEFTETFLNAYNISFPTKKKSLKIQLIKAKVLG